MFYCIQRLGTYISIEYHVVSGVGATEDRSGDPITGGRELRCLTLTSTIGVGVLIGGCQGGAHHEAVKIQADVANIGTTFANLEEHFFETIVW